jgi:ABC-type spermidine/putrescine transport system permease subunit I
LVALGVFDRPRLLTHNRIGVMIAETYLLLPYAVLVLTTALDRIDPTLTAAARGLGAGPWQSFRRVTLPLSLPGLALAGQLSLVWALGALLGPFLLGGPDETTLAVEVQQQTLEKSNWPRGAAHAVLMLATLAVCLSIYAAPARLRKNS